MIARLNWKLFINLIGKNVFLICIHIYLYSIIYSEVRWPFDVSLPSDLSINLCLLRGSYYSAQFHCDWVSLWMNECLKCTGALFRAPGMLQQIKQRSALWSLHYDWIGQFFLFHTYSLLHVHPSSVTCKAFFLFCCLPT